MIKVINHAGRLRCQLGNRRSEPPNFEWVVCQIFNVFRNIKFATSQSFSVNGPSPRMSNLHDWSH